MNTPAFRLFAAAVALTLALNAHTVTQTVRLISGVTLYAHRK